MIINELKLIIDSIKKRIPNKLSDLKNDLYYDSRVEEWILEQKVRSFSYDVNYRLCCYYEKFTHNKKLIPGEIYTCNIDGVDYFGECVYIGASYATTEHYSIEFKDESASKIINLELYNDNSLRIRLSEGFPVNEPVIVDIGIVRHSGELKQIDEKFIPDTQIQVDWNQNDEFALDYIKNKPFYDNSQSGGELKKIDNKYLPDGIASCNTAEVGQIIVVKSVNENGVPIEWEAVNGQNNQNYLILKDMTTGYSYTVYMNNGSLESHIKINSIEARQLPNKTDYTNDELFDPTGMIIYGIADDGSEIEIINYEYDRYVTTGSKVHEIRCHDSGIMHTVEIPITTRSLEAALFDFNCVVDDNARYCLTGWKGTLNGEPSTRMLIPNSDMISL